MGSNKKKKPNNNYKNNNSKNLLSPATICYEGEELSRLLSSLERQLLIKIDDFISSLKSLETGQESARLADPDFPYKIWLKQQFCVGVNDVTRVLEHMPPFSTNNSSLGHPLSSSEQTHRRKAPPAQLQAILLASDCIPRCLTKHLPTLASSKKVPLIHVKDKKGGSLRLGELVKLRTAIAVGVKVRGNSVNQIIEDILQNEKIKLQKLP